MKEYRLPGEKVTDLESFYKIFGEMVNGFRGYFGKDLQSFDDCFFGSCGLEVPCKIVWENADMSRAVLDEKCLYDRCKDAIDRQDYLDEGGLDWLKEKMKAASTKPGLTMFDAIIDMMKSVTERSGKENYIEVIVS